ncbi:hypothetical protein AB1Y20_008202 [Prymnesium parvum]|uniref:Cation/H+ exchanger transmembrane domain-containing protein n=1 Tax=Prymnesium parvum TaxID=97485 RepID=A0AB34ITI1_PRYPA|mmetsp:Transcript_25627/g.58655  ORF Transcript_25627/g.58655 Transcript_25627/m.58655 type:complete len:441 (-) Transcript_25627:97-1419(-)
MPLLLPVAEVYKLFAFSGALYYGGAAFDALGCPALVGEILVGMLLGPQAAEFLSADLVASLQVAGQAGLCLMVLEGGISMEASVLREKGVRAVVLAATGTALPVLLGWAAMLAMGESVYSALASGIALSSTAIGFTMRMMTEMNLLSTPEGQLITAAAMIDDVFSLILLSMLSVLKDEALDEEGSGAEADGLWRAWTICRPLLASLIVSLFSVACFFVVEAFSPALGTRIGRWPHRLRTAVEERKEELILLVLIGGGVCAAWLSDGLYSTLLLGIFGVGAAFCTQPVARDAWRHVAPVQLWASRFFFGATVGFQIPVRDLFRGGNLGPGLLLTLVAILGKWLSGAWGVNIFHDGKFAGKVYWGTFMRVGCAMIGRGELGFQLATTARNDGIITSEAYSATIWALLLATLLGPYAFRLSMKLTPCGLQKLSSTADPPISSA